MADPAQRDLIHKVNNLLTVIYTQVEVGRSQDSRDAALQALEQIQKAAEATVPFVRDARAALPESEA